MDVDEPAAAGVAATEQGIEHAHPSMLASDSLPDSVGTSDLA